MNKMHTPMTPEELHAYRFIMKGLNEYLVRMQVHAKYGKSREIIVEADKAHAYVSGAAELAIYSGIYVGWLYRQMMRKINRTKRACKARCEEREELYLQELYD